MPTFNRVLSVYQILPGPEATEMACYFGQLAGGKLGGVLAGLGFITPGFLLMLLFAWIYDQPFGFRNPLFQSIFVALQPAVCAMVYRAAHKIGDTSFRDPDTKQFDWRLQLVGALAAFESVLNVNFFIIKIHLGVLYYTLRRRWWAFAAFWGLAPIAVFIGVIAALGPMGTLLPMGVGVSQHLGNTPGAHFVVDSVADLMPVIDEIEARLGRGESAVE